ncbi:MAG: hypothetical protein DMF47_10110 [Verrucomicrobia bacterium]|nr:MAG: hypothetical protein DMF47_10110 [Verrucomicrobiota bacterium]
MSNDGEVNHRFSIFSFFVAGLCVAVLSAVLPANASVNVTQHHNHDSRDGLYIDSAFTPTNSANLVRDTNFNGAITGNVYAQPLYIEDGPAGPMVIAVTESNNVYALDAVTGNIIWQRNVGTPITSGLPCGNITPLGITGTPIVDLPSRSLFLDAETTPTAGTFKHMIYSLNVDTGAINPGWPVDVSAAVSGFDSSVQSERGALGILGSIVYVPYGGRFGDCGSYHGRVVGVQMNNPASVMNWATTITKAGAWSIGGVANDGTNLFVTTGNGSVTGTWGGSEAVIRLQPGPIFSGNPTDYWVPTNWQSLDSGDTDLGGSGPVIVDVPGATPPHLVVALGKDGNAYLINRDNLGGISAPVASLHVSGSSIIQAAATYRTNQGTYVVFRANGSTLSAFRITATNPPAITAAWTKSQSGVGSPFVTSTDGTNNMIVWSVGTGGDQRLHGYDGDTGAVVYSGGGPNDVIGGTHSYSTTGIVARGRIYLAGDNRVYLFRVPIPALQLTLAVSRKTHGSAGTFDIPLPLSGNPGVECRTGGATDDYTLVFTFTNNVTSGNASVTSGIGSVSGTPIFSGNTMTVNLTGVANAQTLTVTLSGVTDEFSQVLPDTPVSVNMLIGDTSGNGVVNATDVAQTKAQVGQPVTGSNFRTDVNASGIINATDVAIVKAHSGQSISAPHARARSSVAIAQLGTSLGPRPELKLRPRLCWGSLEASNHT